MPTTPAASSEIVDTAGRASQATLRAPLVLPLGAVGFWTAEHRAALEARHAERRERADAAGAAAFDALHRTAPDPELVGRLTRSADGVGPPAPGEDLPTITVGTLAPMLAPGHVEPTAPPYDPAPTVERQRGKWVAYRDRKGRARRRWEVRRVAVEAHKAHASTAAWHRARGEGQRHRMKHVGACGVGTVSVSCAACGVVHDAPAWCGVVRLCPGCNARRARRMQARFGVALAVVLKNAERAGSLHRQRPGGAISQHHIALTTPHVEARPEDVREVKPVGGAWAWCAVEHRAAYGARNYGERQKATAKRRVMVVLGAWKRFASKLQAWFRSPWSHARWAAKRAVGACWHRAFEWTPGADGMGHPHLHMWALTPWIPEHDDHRVATGGGRTTRCAAGRRLAGAWGWAETMRRERCPHCVGPEAREYQSTDELGARRWHVVHLTTRAPEGAWGWTRSDREARTLDAYYTRPRAPWWKRPAIERRTGLRTWWADALAAEGAPVDERIVSVIVRQAFARPQLMIQEVRKPNGLVFHREVNKRVEIRDASGQLIRYFEGWCIAHENAAVPVLAGVYEALEGKRLSQSSKVLLKGGEVKGLLGIADERVDASCRDCTDVASAIGAEAPAFAAKHVEVTTWKRVVAARVGPPLPPSTAPPSEPLPVREESYGEFVKRLLRTENLADGAELRRTLEICADIRAEGPGILPVYRRSGAPRAPASRRGLRDLMRMSFRR